MSTATLRPNSTISAFGSVTGAANEHTATSDNSDASYATGNSAEYGLGTVAMGAGSVSKQVRVRWRGRYDTVDASTVVALRSSGATIASQSVVANGTITTYTGTYAATGLSQAEVDALTIRVTADAAVRAYELYVDHIYVTIPVVALDAITDPYTASSVISCSWVNTLDSDGGGQTAYQLWVTADVGGATVYDSGVVASSATSADTGPLVSGADYTVHIKVAQTVNGAYHWSAEDTQAAVSLSVTTSDVDTVAGVADNSNAKITVTVERDTGSSAWDFVEVERSTDGGTTWEAVRGATYVDATGDADTFVIDDYEVPNGTAADYRARATRIASALPVVGAWVETVSTATWTSTAVWFKVPGTPALNDTFNFKVYPNANRPQRRGVFHVLGAARPVTVTDVRSSPIAQCSVQTSTEAEADSLLDVLAEPVVLIQAPTTMKRWGSRYCSIGDLGDDPVDPNTLGNSGWAVWSFDAVEVDAPADPDAGSA